MRDVDDVENAERDRDADRHRGVESAEQEAGDQRVDQQIEAEAHLFPRRSTPTTLIMPGADEPLCLAVRQDGCRLGQLSVGRASRAARTRLTLGVGELVSALTLRPCRRTLSGSGNGLLAL